MGRYTTTVNGLRLCRGCDARKPVTEFRVQTIRGDKRYLSSRCRSCIKVARKEWYHRKGGADYYRKYRKEDKHKKVLARNSRRYRLRTVFDLSEEDYQNKLIQQDNACAICRVPQKAFKKRFAVDHDHRTGQVRALLCSRCNTGLGLFQDDPDVLQQAMNYLVDWGR